MNLLSLEGKFSFVTGAGCGSGQRKLLAWRKAEQLKKFEPDHRSSPAGIKQRRWIDESS